MKWTKTKSAMAAALAAVVLSLLILLARHAVHLQQAGNYPNIQGAWEGIVKVSNMNLRVRLNIEKTNGTYSATADSIDQGAKNMPVGKIVYNYPDFHFVIESVGGEYNGKFNAQANELSGQWTQGKETLPLEFKFTTNAAPEALADAAVAPSTNSEVQGVWNGTLSGPGGLELRLRFKIAEPSPGTVTASIDSIDQGANNIMATSADCQDHVFKAEFAGIGGSFEGKVSGGGIDGQWKQGGKSLPLKLKREDADAQPEPTKTYYITRNDLPGHWKGTLNVKTIKLHLVFNIAQLPDGSFATTMDSPDQGAKDIPATDTQYTAPNLKISWRALAGSFDGTFKNGKLSGTWQQPGVSLPLALSRD